MLGIGTVSSSYPSRDTTLYSSRKGVAVGTGTRSRELTAPERVTTPPQQLEVRLLGGFEFVRAGRAIPLPLPAQRLVAFLALESAWVSRSHAAGNLWLEVPQQRALGSLRSALWKARSTEGHLLEITGDEFRLAADVRVDTHDTSERAYRLLDGLSSCSDELLTSEGMTKELLPSWFDDWVLLERERLRQLFLHAMEALTRHLSGLGQHARAIDVGTIVVQQEPLRESAHAALMQAYLAEGNRHEAMRQYDAYRRLMSRELGLDPSPRLRRLLANGLHRPT